MERPSSSAISRLRTRPAAFTLVELLVVIAIIGVLVALLLPAIQAARESARRTDCINRIRQLALAALNYESAREVLPPHGDLPTALSAIARVMPFMENKSVHDLVDQDQHWRETPNQRALNTPLTFLRCPSGNEMESTFINARDTGVVRESNLRSHYVGNLGARPTECASAGPTSNVFPDNTYTQYVNASATALPCGDDPALPSTLAPPPVNNPGQSPPGTGGVAINGTIFPISKLRMGLITDGASLTMMFGEMSWDIGPQEPWIVGSTSQNTGPNNTLDPVSSAHGVVYNAKAIRWAPNSRKFIGANGRIEALLTSVALGSNHPGGTHIVMCDNSAKFISDDIDVEGVYRRMASRASDDNYTAP